jgi:hypothetical protein
MNVALNQQAGAGIPVEFVNGTGNPDMGIVAASRLRELGFDVVSGQEAGEVISRTRVVDFTTTTKGSALPRLQSAFQIKPEFVSREPNPDGPRYRIVAGRDFDPCYARGYAFTQGSIATPTPAPAAVPDPNAAPAADPNAAPAADPNAAPAADPNAMPTADPNAAPTADPNAAPTADPNAMPTVEPTPEG